MKRIFLFTAVIGLTLLACSCRTGTTKDGKSCYELTESDKEFMVNYTVKTLTRGKKSLLRAGEVDIIANRPPEINMTYYGDKCGVLTITWHTRTREVGMLYDGVIRSGRERMHLISVEKNPAVMDYSGMLSDKAKRNVEKIQTDGDAPGRLIKTR